MLFSLNYQYDNTSMTIVLSCNTHWHHYQTVHIAPSSFISSLITRTMKIYQPPFYCNLFHTSNQWWWYITVLYYESYIVILLTRHSSVVWLAINQLSLINRAAKQPPVAFRELNIEYLCMLLKFQIYQMSRKYIPLASISARQNSAQWDTYSIYRLAVIRAYGYYVRYTNVNL